jgi:hypothetical protein
VPRVFFLGRSRWVKMARFAAASRRSTRCLCVAGPEIVEGQVAQF